MGPRLWGAVFCVFAVLTAPVRGADDLLFTSAPRVSAIAQQNLLDVTWAGDRLLLVGAAGLVGYSDDNGQSWTQADVPISGTLTAVDFPAPELGWAVGHGGVILHSRDGGQSWERQFDGIQANAAFLTYATGVREALEAQLASMADDADAGEREDLEYAIEDAVFMEEDAQLAVDTGPADPFLDVVFLNEDVGLAVGAYGMFFRTTDAGASWQINLAGIENIDRFHYYKLHVDDSGWVYLVGEAGLLYLSKDAGLSFERFWDVYEGSLFGVAPVGSAVEAFGLRGNRFSFDGPGNAWNSVQGESTSSLYGGTGLADGGALLVGAGGTLLRLDAEGRERIYRHPSRSTFSAALEGRDGKIWIVGMGGLTSFDEAESP